MQAGGIRALSAADTHNVMWGFATLGYTPERLLFTIRPDWAWVCKSQPDKRLPSKGVCMCVAMCVAHGVCVLVAYGANKGPCLHLHE